MNNKIFLFNKNKPYKIFLGKVFFYLAANDEYNHSGEFHLFMALDPWHDT